MHQLWRHPTWEIILPPPFRWTESVSLRHTRILALPCVFFFYQTPPCWESLPLKYHLLFFILLWEQQTKPKLFAYSSLAVSGLTSCKYTWRINPLVCVFGLLLMISLVVDIIWSPPTCPRTNTATERAGISRSAEQITSCEKSKASPSDFR